MPLKNIAIIPARGGSKGLPGKNIRLLCGKPLIVWSIEQALQSGIFDTVVVSTDSKEIADIAAKHGAKVPFLRPPELSTDIATSVDVVLHTLDFYKQMNNHFDIFALLEPTSPLRKKGQLQTMLTKLRSSDHADAIVSIGEIHLEHPYIVKKIDNNGYLVPFMSQINQISRRQDLNTSYFPYGVAYVVKTKCFLREKTFYPQKTIPFLIERWQNYEIDDYWDFECIEKIFAIQQKEII